MFFKTNSTKVSLREYLFEGPLLLKPIVGLIAVVVKLFRIRLPGSVDFPPVDRLSPFQISSGSMSQEFMDVTASERQSLERDGFIPCADLFINDVTHNTRYAGFVYCSADRHCIAWVRVRRWPNLPAKSKTTRVQFISVTHDGKAVVTTSANRDLLEPPQWSVQFHQGVEPTKLYQAHREHLAKYANSQPTRHFETPQDALDQLDQLQLEFSSFQQARGVFEPQTEQYKGSSQVPVTATVVSNNHVEPAFDFVQTPDGLVASQLGQASQPTAMELQQPASAEDLIIAEVRKQETKQTNLLSKLILLGVSVLAFVVAGGAIWDWSFALLLIPILLLHELGHLVAMKIFGYKNVKMFFIPFLGAAVTGRHYNVEGWKKAIVSLAGPVPSICIAIVVEIFGFMLQIEWMTHAALVMLLLNLFNLLPFLPLDGGWVAHVTLFSRSKYLDIAFRIIAILAMFAASIFLEGRFLMYLGIAMAIGLPAMWRTLKVQEKLNQVALPPASSDLIPEEAIRQISQACQAANLPAINNTQLATTTIHVYEAVNTKPPSWPATIGLWCIHGGAVAVGVLGLLGFLAGAFFKRVGELADQRETTVEYSVPKEDQGYREGTEVLPRNALLMWQFSDPAIATQAFESLSSTNSDSVIRLGTIVMTSTNGKELKGFDQARAVSEFFLRPTQDEKEARNDNRLQSVSSQFKSVDARLFCRSIGSLPTIKVQFDRPEALNKAMLELNSLPSVDFNKQPIAPWTPNRKLTAEQVRLRRLLNVLTENEEKLPWIPESKPDFDEPKERGAEKADASETAKSYEERLELIKASQADINQKKLNWIHSGLSRSSGETKKMIEAYLRYDAAFKSAIERSEADEGSADVSFPALHEYLADSAAALGYVEASEPEYRFGARVSAFPDLGETYSEFDMEREPFSPRTNSTETKLIVSVSDTMDSCAAYHALIHWLFQQGAINISIGYQKLELAEDKNALLDKTTSASSNFGDYLCRWLSVHPDRLIKLTIATFALDLGCT